MSDPTAEDQQTHKRICDFCSDSVAILFCRADAANLCLSCDREVHSTNPLFTKHTRWQICDSCDSTPATILCSTENTVLCQNCDWETHNNSSLHERRPIEGFSGCPSVTELSTVIMGFDFDSISKKDLFLEEKEKEQEHGFGFGFGYRVESDQEFSVWDTPPIISLDDLMLSNNSAHNFQAMGVPPLPKNRKAACGRYKDEIVRQLRKMAESEPNLNDHISWDDNEPFFDYKELFADQEDPNPIILNSEAGEIGLCNEKLEIGNKELCDHLVPNRDSDAIDVVPAAVREMTAQERDSAISRYKEKKKMRRYDKHVRYESRKVRAEARTRVRGRFAKTTGQ
ncbi:zinc finger protein CONSTANS-LIKE 13 [Impatiens glandulifera]|uniref:zinc finger protein CONSTANS-LIKE 13 n=1 Tax=Impatiens glandulifera TaxID=253017 RepID=UPI001FB16AB2|nr:zinc finger protein CONSTANS-LIKE 13 [Impatiens glandulifera]